MLISIIVPFHNVEQYIASCVEALLAANSPQDRYEILMVDNNSTDRSAEIVRRYPRMRLLSESKPGAYAARNRGVAESSGSILAFTDSDCAPSADWLDAIARAFSDPEVLLVQGRQRFPRQSLALSLLSDYEAERAAYVFASRVPPIYYGYTNNMAVRRSVFDRVGPFLELERGADTIFVQKVLAEYPCESLRYRSDMLVTHLEITSAASWLHKMHIYGRSSRRYGALVHAKPLTSRQRLQIARAVVQHGRYSAAKSALLIALLFVGAVLFAMGRWRGAPR